MYMYACHLIICTVRFSTTSLLSARKCESLGYDILCTLDIERIKHIGNWKVILGCTQYNTSTQYTWFAIKIPHTRVSSLWYSPAPLRTHPRSSHSPPAEVGQDPFWPGSRWFFPGSDNSGHNKWRIPASVCWSCTAWCRRNTRCKLARVRTTRGEAAPLGAKL